MTPPLAARLFVLSLAACGFGTAAPAPEPPPAPAMPARVVPLAPTKVSGQDLATRMKQPGTRVRIFNFWASWCQPCLQEMPILVDFARRHPDAEVLLVNVDQSTVQDARVPALIDRLGLASVGHLLLDSADPNVTLRTWVPGWPEQLPTTVVVAADGSRTALIDHAVDPMDLDAVFQQARRSRR